METDAVFPHDSAQGKHVQKKNWSLSADLRTDLMNWHM